MSYPLTFCIQPSTKPDCICHCQVCELDNLRGALIASIVCHQEVANIKTYEPSIHACQFQWPKTADPHQHFARRISCRWHTSKLQLSAQPGSICKVARHGFVERMSNCHRQSMPEQIQRLVLLDGHSQSAGQFQGIQLADIASRDPKNCMRGRAPHTRRCVRQHIRCSVRSPALQETLLAITKWFLFECTALN